jgi:membrane fusion protein (multidrug efflux system)
MKRRIIITIVGLVAIIGTLGGIKGLQIGAMTAQGKQSMPPPTTVTTATVASESWEATLSSVGSLVAVQGVTISAELSGKVVKIAFEPGAKVQAGDLLVQLDTTSEAAQLNAAEAALALAKADLQRADQLLAEQVLTPATHDKTVSVYKQALAEVDRIRTLIAKKTIRAPFTGRLGIRQINLGQFLNEGQPIVSLQSLDPIFANFSLPQQELSQLHRELKVRVTTDAAPGRVFEGRITAINPEVDPATRNVGLQATLSNADEQLRPGMFVNVAVILPVEETRLIIPATAILYAPYSDSVFVVEEQPGTDKAPAHLAVRQQFVRLGEKRGDFVSVSTGLKAGDTVVSTGVFKLRNGQNVVVDNTLAPEFKLAPQPSEG